MGPSLPRTEARSAIRMYMPYCGCLKYIALHREEWRLAGHDVPGKCKWTSLPGVLVDVGGDFIDAGERMKQQQALQSEVR